MATRMQDQGRLITPQVHPRSPINLMSLASPTPIYFDLRNYSDSPPRREFIGRHHKQRSGITIRSVCFGDSPDCLTFPAKQDQQNRLNLDAPCQRSAGIIYTSKESSDRLGPSKGIYKATTPAESSAGGTPLCPTSSRQRKITNKY